MGAQMRPMISKSIAYFNGRRKLVLGHAGSGVRRGYLVGRAQPIECHAAIADGSALDLAKRIVVI